MVVVYPVLIEYDEDSDGYLVEVPDLKVNTNGDSLSDAIRMARDLIGLVCIEKAECGEPLPEPSSISDYKQNGTIIVTPVDVDLAAYRALYGSQQVEVQVHLPQWMVTVAEAESIDLSAMLQEAFKNRPVNED